MNLLALNAMEISRLTNATSLVSNQISTAIYKNGVQDLNSITDISLENRQVLSNHYSIQYPTIRVISN